MRETTVLSSMTALLLALGQPALAWQAAPSPAPTATPAPAAASTPAPLPEDDYRPAQLLTGKRPQYPAKAVRNRVAGTVVVRFEVDEEGKVKKARISRGIEELNNAALDAVRAWKFKPAVKAGQKVQVTLEAPVTFELPE
jgi:periplasmic protein TonB